MKGQSLKYLVFIFLLGCNNSNQSNTINSNVLHESAGTIDSLKDIQSKDTAGLNLKAHLLLVNKEYQDAMREYSRLIDIDSMNGKYYYGKAYCLAQLDQYDQSISYYQKASNLDYDKFESFKSIAVIYYFMLKDNEGAKEYFNKCLEIKPKDKEVESYIEDITNNEKSNL